MENPVDLSWSAHSSTLSITEEMDSRSADMATSVIPKSGPDDQNIGHTMGRSDSELVLNSGCKFDEQGTKNDQMSRWQSAANPQIANIESLTFGELHEKLIAKVVKMDSNINDSRPQPCTASRNVTSALHTEVSKSQPMNLSQSMSDDHTSTSVSKYMKSSCISKPDCSSRCSAVTTLTSTAAQMFLQGGILPVFPALDINALIERELTRTPETTSTAMSTVTRVAMSPPLVSISSSASLDAVTTSASDVLQLHKTQCSSLIDGSVCKSNGPLGNFSQREQIATETTRPRPNLPTITTSSEQCVRDVCSDATEFCASADRSIFAHSTPSQVTSVATYTSGASVAGEINNNRCRGRRRLKSCAKPNGSLHRYVQKSANQYDCGKVRLEDGVRKSNRSNRGRRYSEMISQGILLQSRRRSTSITAPDSCTGEQYLPDADIKHGVIDDVLSGTVERNISDLESKTSSVHSCDNSMEATKPSMFTNSSTACTEASTSHASDGCVQWINRAELRRFVKTDVSSILQKSLCRRKPSKSTIIHLQPAIS